MRIIEKFRNKKTKSTSGVCLSTLSASPRTENNQKVVDIKLSLTSTTGQLGACVPWSDTVCHYPRQACWSGQRPTAGASFIDHTWRPAGSLLTNKSKCQPLFSRISFLPSTRWQGARERKDRFDFTLEQRFKNNPKGTSRENVTSQLVLNKSSTMMIENNTLATKYLFALFWFVCMVCFLFFCSIMEQVCSTDTHQGRHATLYTNKKWCFFCQ